MRPRLFSFDMVALVVLVAGMLLPRTGTAQQMTDVQIPTAVRQAADGITAAKLREDLAYLASDRLQGRRTPSPGLDSATVYVAQKLARWGLQPAGDSGSFYQRYTILRETLDTVATAVELNGRKFHFPDDFRVRWGPRSEVVSGHVAYVGHGQIIRSRGIDPYAAIDYRDKILLMWGPAVVKGLTQAEREDPANMPAPPWFDTRGIIFIPRFDELTRWWQGLRRSDFTPSWDSPPSSDPVKGGPWIYAGPSLVEALMEGERMGADEVFGRSLAGDPPASFELAPHKEVRITIARQTVGTFHPANVVALVEGSDPVLKHEYVTVQAHLDGTQNTAAWPDTILNAADDNASGAAALLGIAEALSRAPRPKRSIVLLWDTGEERGLWGTRHFISQGNVPLEKIAVHFNLDMVGRSKEPGETTAANADLTGPNEVYVIGPRSLSSELDALVEGVNRSYLRMDYNRSKDTWASQWLYPRADHRPFLEHGVPVVFYFTGVHADYHSTSDNPEQIDVKKLERIARSTLVTAWMAANAPTRPELDQPLPDNVKKP